MIVKAMMCCVTVGWRC